MTHRFTFNEVGYGYFGGDKYTDPKYWINKTDTKGRLTDGEIISILLNDRIGSFSNQDSPIRERLRDVLHNLEGYTFEELSKEVKKDVLDTWGSKHATQEDQVDSDDDDYETYVEELIYANNYKFTKDGELKSNLFPFTSSK